MFDPHTTHGKFGLINPSNGKIVLVRHKNESKPEIFFYDSNYRGKLLKLQKKGYYFFEDDENEKGSVLKLKFSRYLMHSKIVKKINQYTDGASFQIKG